MTLPKISESEKKIDDTKMIKKIRESSRMMTSPGKIKPKRSKMIHT